MSISPNEFNAYIGTNNNVLPKLTPYRPFAVDEPKLINFDDEEDGIGHIITHDDDDQSREIKAMINGPRKKQKTQFSRLDFYCKNPLSIHKIVMTEDLSNKCAELTIKVCFFDQQNNVKDLHTRTIKTKNGMHLNFVNFHRSPLVVFGGQKFFVKIKFSELAEVLHLQANGMAANELVELRKDSEVKNYFNCISSLVVSSAKNA